MSKIELIIDGEKIEAAKEDTILKAARKAGINIPTLCAHPALEPYGSCRLCIVKVEGIRGYPTSCTTPVADKMVVTTNSEEILNLRREILKLMMTGHTSPCFVCSDRKECEKYRPKPIKSGKASRCTFCSKRETCELRILADEYKIEDLELPIIYKEIDIERNDPFMDRDYNLCVLCGRCARICKKIHGEGAIDFINRGKDARIGTAFHKTHVETGCKFCGACIDICPTGALTDRFAKWKGAPDKISEAFCALCPIGCSIDCKIKDGNIISAKMQDFSKESRICLAGRFLLPQLLDNAHRTYSHKIRVNDGLIRAEYEDAVSMAAENLEKFKGDAFAIIAHPGAAREEISALKKFAEEVMNSDNFAIAEYNGSEISIKPEAVNEKIKNGKIKALFTTGNFISDDAIYDFLIISDMFASKAAENADVIFSSASFLETGGSFLTASGEVKTFNSAIKLDKRLSCDWKIVSDIAKKMGASGFDFKTIQDIPTDSDEKIPNMPKENPIENISAYPLYYRGHELIDLFPALRSLSSCEKKAEESKEVCADARFKVLEKEEIAPNTHMTVIYAPDIAEKCKPGQFVIVMVNEKSERIPYTISDFDPKKGTITIITIEVGRSSREMANVRAGECLRHITGPLGMPAKIEKYGTVVCAGGCFGVGAMLPVARSLKEAGNKVICVQEAASKYLLYWQDKLSKVCDELIIVTKDGSAGIKGGVRSGIETLIERGEKIDQAFVIGCSFMMKLICDLNKELGIPTQTAMNPIMLDGTGMCGACRVSEGENTKFACVDGPFLDGLKINWDELMKRQTAFQTIEIEGLPQEPIIVEKHKCHCQAH